MEPQPTTALLILSWNGIEKSIKESESALGKKIKKQCYNVKSEGALFFRSTPLLNNDREFSCF